MTRIFRNRPALGFIVAATAFFCAQDASAARIFNFTSQPVDVLQDAKKDRFVSIKAGDRSESLEWGPSPFSVSHPYSEKAGTPVCYFRMGTRELVGGNYLLVVQHGTTVSCTLCDASRKVRFKAAGRVKSGYEYTTPNRPPHGCE